MDHSVCQLEVPVLIDEKAQAKKVYTVPVLTVLSLAEVTAGGANGMSESNGGALTVTS